jgi:hypothetical protein
MQRIFGLEPTTRCDRGHDAGKEAGVDWSHENPHRSPAVPCRPIDFQPLPKPCHRPAQGLRRVARGAREPRGLFAGTSHHGACGEPVEPNLDENRKVIGFEVVRACPRVMTHGLGGGGAEFPRCARGGCAFKHLALRGQRGGCGAFRPAGGRCVGRGGLIKSGLGD